MTFTPSIELMELGGLGKPDLKPYTMSERLWAHVRGLEEQAEATSRHTQAQCEEAGELAREIRKLSALAASSAKEAKRKASNSQDEIRSLLQERAALRAALEDAVDERGPRPALRRGRAGGGDGRVSEYPKMNAAAHAPSQPEPGGRQE